jgi:hypothetical protein
MVDFWPRASPVAGQGWQHKYGWLPDNDDMHFAGSIEAKIDIKQGQIGKFWFIDLPPFRITFGITVEFGEFCKNSNCTQYEGGIKGKLTVLGFDVGLYVGFQTGVSFILGSDGHVLIDQYGGSQLRPDRAHGAIDMPLINGQPVAFERRVVPNAAAAVFTQPITITANTGSFLAALSWAQCATAIIGAPRLDRDQHDQRDHVWRAVYKRQFAAVRHIKSDVGHLDGEDQQCHFDRRLSLCLLRQ